MAKDKTNFEQIREEITGMVARVRAADHKAAEEENQIRADYEAAQQEMAAALESGSMEQYKAAGMKAEGKRLELEFIEKRKERYQEPGASVEDENRIRAAMVAECERIRVDALAQLKTIFTEAKDVANDALRQFSALDNLFTSFENVVMRKPGAALLCDDSDRLMMAQMENSAKADLDRYQYIKGFN